MKKIVVLVAVAAVLAACSPKKPAAQKAAPETKANAGATLIGPPIPVPTSSVGPRLTPTVAPKDTPPPKETPTPGKTPPPK